MKLYGKEMLDIKYIDNHILVALKEGGLLTQESELNKNSLEEKLKNWIKNKIRRAATQNLLISIFQLPASSSNSLLIHHLSR